MFVLAGRMPHEAAAPRARGARRVAWLGLLLAPLVVAGWVGVEQWRRSALPTTEPDLFAMIGRSLPAETPPEPGGFHTEHLLRWWVHGPSTLRLGPAWDVELRDELRGGEHLLYRWDMGPGLLPSIVVLRGGAYAPEGCYVVLRPRTLAARIRLWLGCYETIRG